MKNTISILFTILSIVLLLLSFPVSANAQTEKETSLEHLLDDGKSNHMVFLKADLMRYLDGSLSLSGEYRTKKMGLELCYGVQRSPIVSQIRPKFWENLRSYPNLVEKNHIEGGYLLQAGIRYYSLGGQHIGFEGEYGLIYVKRNVFNMTSGDTYATIEYCLGGGVEFVTERRFVCDLNLAGGYRRSIGWDNSGSFMYNISILLGYRII